MVRPGGRLAAVASVFVLPLYLSYRLKRPMNKGNVSRLYSNYRVPGGWGQLLTGQGMAGRLGLSRISLVKPSHHLVRVKAQPSSPLPMGQALGDPCSPPALGVAETLHEPR
jgi:hypothetical protein